MIRLFHKAGVVPPVSITNVRCFHATACVEKNRKAGKPKVSVGRRVKWLKYEEAKPPEQIGHTKAWNSWNTSNLHGEESKTAEVTLEDMIIRKFMHGIFPEVIESEVIIKRRHNLIVVAAILNFKRLSLSRVYFLVGYGEELLSHWLKRPIRFEISTINDDRHMRFKLI